MPETTRLAQDHLGRRLALGGLGLLGLSVVALLYVLAMAPLSCGTSQLAVMQPCRLLHVVAWTSYVGAALALVLAAVGGLLWLRGRPRRG